MKKILKSRLFTFILGGIVFGTIGVFASNIFASQVTYNDTTVDLALDNVYTNLNTKMAMNTFGTSQYAYSQGNFIANRTVTLSNLSKGKYILISTISSAYSTSSNPEELHTEFTANNLGCTSGNCVLHYINGFQNRKSATGEVKSGYKINNYIGYNFYYLEVLEDTDTVTYMFNDTSASNSNVRILTLAATPIIQN